ncbi:hypothetical protein FOFC_16145, partial [Fusarium oxysporum]
ETTLRTDTSPRPEAPLRSIDEQASSLPCLNPIRVSVVCGATLPSGQIATGEDEVEETLPAVEAPESHAFPQYNHDEGNSIRPGRPQIDPAVSPRERTRVRVQRHRDQQHLTRAQQIVQWFADSQDPPPTLEFSALTLRDGPAPSSVPDEAVEDGEGDDGSESFGFDNDVALGPTSPTPPAPPASARRDSQPPQHRISLPSTPTFPVSPDAAAVSSSLGSDDPVLSGFLEAIRQQDTAGGPDFLLAQSDAYDQILRKFFSHQCDCPEPRAREEPEHTSTLPEYVQHISRALPPLPTVFAGRDEACDPRASFSQWQSFLSDQPAEPLSFRKTQASLSQDAVTIARQWDVDSVWFGARSLSAIRAPNQFRLSFFSPHTSNISTAQVIQPHGLDLAHTRHTIIGTFTTAGVRFSVLMFFPSGAPSQTRASTNSLSLARFRDLYDEIILPAVRETVPIHVRQEIPGSYDLIYAKSRAYQEKPGAGRWSAEDESRSYRLAYGIPASVLPQFWAAVVRNANRHRLQSKKGDAVPYFQNPRLLFQAHDLKNMFASESLQDSLCLFRDSILAGLDPSQIDMHSCWLDVGMRDHVLMPPTSSIKRLLLPEQHKQPPAARLSGPPGALDLDARTPHVAYCPENLFFFAASAAARNTTGLRQFVSLAETTRQNRWVEMASSLPCLNPIRVSVVCGATLPSGQIATGEDEVEETLPAVEAPESHAFPQYDHDEGNSIRPGRPQIDPAVSPRERTRVRVQRHRDQQHLTRAQQIVQWFADSQDPPPTLEFSALTLHDGPAPSSVPDEAVEDGEGDDGSESFGFDNDVALGPTSPTPPAPPASTRRDSQPPHHRISLPSTPTFPVSPDAAAVSSSLGSDDPVLSGFLEAIRQQDTAGGPDFLLAQSDAYDQILRKFFSHQCDCPEPRAREEPEHTSTLPEYVQHISRALPPLPTVFAGHDEACDPRASFSQWQSFLSDQPAEPLSFRKTQASLSQDAVTIARQWDVDSVWFGARSLSAIRAPNQFRLSFFSPHTSNISTAQVIQPHGLDLAHTRHTIIGTFTTAGVRFSVLMFFPSGAPSQTRASTNSLSLARFRDLYDEIILPAVRETVPIHVRQEIPGSYDLIYAKSRAYQEKPGAGRWSAEDESRSYRLAYGIPASVLPQFWAAVVRNANRHRLQSKKGDAVPYFQNPRLLFQAHDLKNMFASESLQDSLCLFRDSILAGLDPSQIDMHSCWLDVGMRDHVLMPPTSSNSESQNHHHHEPWTLLWKSDCCRHLHDQVVGVAPEAPMEATYYRPYLLRDIGGYYVRAKSTRKSNPGHPEARSPGVIRAKAYNCSKELFGVMFSDYQLFSSGFLPLLAFGEGMLKDLAATDQSRQRAFVSQLSRSRILDAWDANKRHMRAVSSLKRQSDFGIRKEVTLRLDVILAMWVGGRLEPNQSPHTGPMCWEVPLAPPPPPSSSLSSSPSSPSPPIVGEEQHWPFWVIPTQMLTAFVSAQAARFILPLDHIFSEVTTASSADRSTSPPDPARQMLAFYTAQLFCRLLIHAVSSEREYSFDNWIWKSTWQVKCGSPRSGRRKERRGLGLGDSIRTSGTLWIPDGHINWQTGHISLELLVNIYMSRSPLQAKLAHQANVQAFATNQVTIELLFQRLVRNARAEYDRGRNQDAEILADRAVALAVEEIARAYHQHFLAKLHSYWDRLRGKVGRQKLPVLDMLQQAQEESAAETGRIPTAQAVHGIYAEAWDKYRQATADDDSNGDINTSSSSLRSALPEELPCWMTTRRRLPPKNSWSAFLFDQIFCRPKPPTWNALFFLQLYRGFKKFWQDTCAPLGPFDGRFSRQIGYYIQIAFNCDHTKEVGTSHAQGTWYHAKPSFFQIQYWAPYFSPPRTQEMTSLSSIYRLRSYPEGLSPRSTPLIPSPRNFHDIESAAWPHWVEIMHHSRHDDLDRLPFECRNSIRRHCKRALFYTSYLAGPTWGLDKDVNFIVPWSIDNASRDSSSEWDVFRVPVAETHISKTIFEDTVSQPTILLPTRDTIIGLLDAIKILTGHSSSITKRLSWTKRRLNNQGDQYDLPSHLAARHREVGPSTESQSLLERFLHQREPPEWDVEPVDEQEAEDTEETAEEDNSSSGEDNDDDDLEDIGLNDLGPYIGFVS